MQSTRQAGVIHSAIRSLQTGTKVANLVHLDFHTFAETAENIVYNLTILYGEKVGGILLAQFTEFLANVAINKLSDELCEELIEFLIDSADFLLTKGAISFVLNHSKSAQEAKASAVKTASASLAHGVNTHITPGIKFLAEPIGQALGGEVAKSFADAYIGKGKLAKLINEAILKIEINARKEALRNNLLIQKQILLQPKKMAATRESKFIAEEKQKEAEKQAEIQRKEALAKQELQAKQQEEAAKKLAEERKQAIADSNYLTAGVRRMAYFVSDTASTAASTTVSIASGVSSAATATASAAGGAISSAAGFVSENSEAIVGVAGAIGGFTGTLDLKNSLKSKFGFDISSTQDFDKINQWRVQHLAAAGLSTKAKAFIKDSTHTSLSLLSGAAKVAQQLLHGHSMLVDKHYREHNRIVGELKRNKEEEKKKQQDQYLKERRKFKGNLLFNVKSSFLSLEITQGGEYESKATYDKRLAAAKRQTIQERMGFTSDELQELKLEQDCFLEVHSETEIAQLQSLFSQDAKTQDEDRQRKIVILPEDKLLSHGIQAGAFVSCSRENDERLLNTLREYKAQPGTPIISDKTCALYARSLKICEMAKEPKKSRTTSKDESSQTSIDVNELAVRRYLFHR